MKRFIKNNAIFFVYFIFSLFLELFSLLFLTNSIFITSPWLSLSIIGIICCLCSFIKSSRVRRFILLVFFTIQAIINLFCITLYENTGTLFDFSMISLARETSEFAGTITINYLYVAFLVALVFLFSLTSYFCDKFFKTIRIKLDNLISSVCLVVCLISQISVVFYSNRISEDDFVNSLYVDSNAKYNSFGNSGAFVNELYKMLFFSKYEDFSYEEIEEYIYKEVSTPTDKFGVSSDNNLVTILVESFEWFAFVSDPSIYPHGSNLDEEKLDLLFPNIRDFYNKSVVMENHHSENKTDISEDEALFGAYPSSVYVNYGFPNNTIITSIANNLKNSNESITNNFFHNNRSSFYNREIVSKAIGYDNAYFIDDMAKNGAINYMDKNEVNLDSEMIESMKDTMFTTDSRFNTHITTISMHGNYGYRPNMERWYNKLNETGVTISNTHLKNYIVSVMEFDCALGMIIDDLNKKNLMDKTTIVVFADHNTYMNNLTNYVKNIYDISDDNYNELFRVPLMIYDPSIEHAVINKFTTTYDITPTILDMFGFNYYTNLYYGNSIFSKEESVLYSKAFNVFIANGLYFSNIENILHRREDISDEEIEIVKAKCLALLLKIYYTNHLFDYDYFKNDENKKTYYSKMALIN